LTSSEQNPLPSRRRTNDDTFYKNEDKNGGMPLNKIEKAKDDLNFGQK